MNLFKTTVLAPDDPEAGATFADLIRNQPFLLLVVLGDRQQLVEWADLLAGSAIHESWRRVVWIQNPETVAEILHELDGTRSDGLPSIRSEGVAAFAVSLADNVRDVILDSDLDFPKARLLEAYIAAEATP